MPIESSSALKRGNIEQIDPNIQQVNPEIPASSDRQNTFYKIGAGLGIVAASASLLAGTAKAEERPFTISRNQESVLKPDIKSSHEIKRESMRERERCARQKEIDPRQFSSCEYDGAYAAISNRFPRWVKKHDLEKPGNEQKFDRKVAYFKTHPKEYKTMRLEGLAGKGYQTPREWIWESVNSRECSGTWNCNTGNGYFGGLQMDYQFQATYNPKALRIWGTANNWPREAQELAADRAFDGYRGFGPRGLGPWPSSNAALGTFPDRIR